MANPFPGSENYLSGPDVVSTEAGVSGPQPAAPASYTGSLSGPDESITSVTEGPKASGSLYMGAATEHGGIATEGAGGFSSKVKGSGSSPIGPESIATYGEAIFDTGSPYYFMGSMSKEVLNRYLDRAIQMHNFCGYAPEIDPITGNFTLGSASPTEYSEDMAMLLDLNPYMVWDMTGDFQDTVYGYKSDPNSFVNLLINTQKTIDILKAANPYLICGACIAENINAYWLINNTNSYSFDPIYIPNYIFMDLGLWYDPGSYDTASNSYTKTYTPSVLPVNRYDTSAPDYLSPFYFDSNQPYVYNPATGKYDFPTGDAYQINGDGPSSKPDITKYGTMMLFYYYATQYINVGIEHIHWGDFFTNTNVDNMNGNYCTWFLFSNIRQYAAKYATRGLILMDSHVDYDHISGLNTVYYDPRTGPDYTIEVFPDWQRQLLFDFHSFGVYTLRNYAVPCSEGYLSYQPLITESKLGLINNSPGGINPLGWYCASNPYFLHFDNDSGLQSCEISGPDGCKLYYDAGCSTHTDNFDAFHMPEQGWGWDQISWFASQGNLSLPEINSFVRNNILVYFYNKIKCLDSVGHFSMSGRSPIWKGNSFPHTMYRANMWTADGGLTEAYQQQDTIKNIWNSVGIYANYSNWVLHNFTVEEVLPSYSDVASSLVFWGTDRMYYIATDGYIHSYVYSKPDDVWFFANVSFAAESVYGTLMSSQTMAKSDLVVSPDGNMLLYIGTDGYIHGYIFHSFWDYSYIYSDEYGVIVPAGFSIYDGFMKKFLLEQKITAHSCLIFPFDDRIYYIGTYIDGTSYIQGFQNYGGLGWNTVSPSYSASSLYSHIGQNIASQFLAGGALTYDSNVTPNRIYYRSSNDSLPYGYLAYFLVNDIRADYFYVPCPANFTILLPQNLMFQGNIAIHYDAGKNETRIYYIGLYTDGSFWVYCLIDNNSSWGSIDPLSWSSVSPTFSAAIYNGQPTSTQLQSIAAGNIAVSPDGNTIAYFAVSALDGGSLVSVCYYKNIDGLNYSFSFTEIFLIYATFYINSLQFVNNDDLFFVSSENDNVYHLIYEEAFCDNPSIAGMEIDDMFYYP